MKEQYIGKLRCSTCGDEESFESNEDKSYIKCVRCNREYFRGYDELVELNQEAINELKQQIRDDAEDYIKNMLQDSFKGNKYFKLK